MELQQQTPTREGLTFYRTIVVVDLVGYSDLARALEENTSAMAVAALNGQIQSLIRSGLSPLPEDAEYFTVAGTGDGIILAFESAVHAHLFAEQLHLNAEKHNRSRTQESATRWFRVGIASGEITRTNLEKEDCGWAGIAIANAVRLESAAKRGEIVMDVASFEALPEDVRRPYGGESTVRGKRAELFRVHKYRVVAVAAGMAQAPAKASLAFLPRPVRTTRRRMVLLGAGAGGAAALGAWFERGEVERMMHPLPLKRYVALHAWPAPGEEVAAIVNRVVATIEDRLARAEASDKQFMVMYPGDPLYVASGWTIAGEGLAEVADALGANLVLATSLRRVRDRLHMVLQLVDPGTARVLRHREISTRLSEVSGLSRIAADAAAWLLELPLSNKAMADEEETGEMSSGAFQLLVDGKRMVDEANEADLDAGVEKLQQLVNEYPRFAIGYAELARGYLRKYVASPDRAMLDLAKQNTERALRLNPNSMRAVVGDAQEKVYSGEGDAALAQFNHALKLDPQNPEVLIYKALVYRNVGKLKEEEGVYRQILVNRPNYWIARNELGGVLARQGNLRKASEEFYAATQIAPKVAMPLANLGSVYLQGGLNAQAKDAFDRSNVLQLNHIAMIGLGDLAFEGRDYNKAMECYRRAHELKPKDDSVLRDLGDCYNLLGQTAKMKDAFGQAARVLSARLAINEKSAVGWMTLSFYQAKTGNFAEAKRDIAAAEEHGGKDLESQFMKAQTLAVMGEKDEALGLVVKCVRGGLPKANVELAVDLKDVREDARYRAALQENAKGPDASPGL